MKAVFAVDAMGGYAYKGDLPWKFGDYPDDKNWYLNQIHGKKQIMGRKTYEAAARSGVRVPKDSVVISSRSVSIRMGHSVDVIKYDTFLKLSDQYEDHVVIGGWHLISSLMHQGTLSKICITKIPHIHRATQFIPTGPVIPLTYVADDTIETQSGLTFRTFIKR